MVLKKIVSVYLKSKDYPQNQPSLIFPNIKYADMNNGIIEFVMVVANHGFSLFGLEVSLEI